MINIYNMHDTTRVSSIYDVRIDRKTIFGNPFPMKKESERDVVCDLYDDYFNQRIQHDKKFKEALDLLVLFYIINHNVNLLCWCVPKRCHGLTLKRYIEQELKAKNIAF